MLNLKNNKTTMNKTYTIEEAYKRNLLKENTKIIYRFSEDIITKGIITKGIIGEISGDRMYIWHNEGMLAGLTGKKSPHTKGYKYSILESNTSGTLIKIIEKTGILCHEIEFKK